MGLAYLHAGKYNKATECLESASEIAQGVLMSQVDLIFLYTTKGSSDQANAVMEDIKIKLTEGKYVSSLLMSFALGHLGNIDEAINWLEKAYVEHDGGLYVIKYYPWVPVKLRKDSRFQSFLRKMNFPE